MPRRNEPELQSEIDARRTARKELKPGQCVAHIFVSPDGAAVKCLLPECDWQISVSKSTVPVMEEECRSFYRDHRKLKHGEYRGPNLFVYELAPGWKG